MKIDLTHGGDDGPMSFIKGLTKGTNRGHARSSGRAQIPCINQLHFILNWDR